MTWCLVSLLLLGPIQEDAQLTEVLREWVYQAEVFGRSKESLESLRALMRVSSESQRPEVTHALALVKFGMGNEGEEEAVFAQLQEPRGVIQYQGLSYVLHGNSWLESGDWVGSYYFLEINNKAILFQTHSGFRREILLAQPLQVLPSERACFLNQAPLADVLTFLARQAQLNTFLPARLNTTLSGQFVMTDWLTLLDSVCRQAHISWTRRGGSALFLQEYQGKAPKTPIIKNLDRKNESLERFTKSLADAFALELIFDDRLSDITITIYAEDQPWDETLDCLAMMNNFNWDLIQNGGEKPKLVITSAY